MKQTVKIYFNYLVLYYKTLHEYKLNWFLSFVKIPIIFAMYWFIWKTLFHYQNGFVGSFSFDEMILYLFAVQWIHLVVSFGVSEKIAEDIRKGSLIIYLARPVRYLPAQFATFLGNLSFGMITTAIPFFVLLSYFKGGFFSPFLYIKFFMLLFTSGVLFFLLECCFGIAGFWLNKIFGLHFLLMTFFNIAGGKLIPLTLFPPWFQKLSYLSPLRAIYFEPVSIFFGRSFLEILLFQVFWLIPLSLVVHFLWNRGKLTYEAFG